MVTFNGLHPKLIDFGLSDADSFAMLKVAAGTQYYASPELLVGDNVDSRTDIWSLGIIMQEFGRRYRRVSAKCLKRNPADRYPNADSVTADIAGLGKGRGMWLGIAAALVALFVLSGFLGRDFLGFDTGRSGSQADSLGIGSGPAASLDSLTASPDGLQSGPAGDVAPGLTNADGTSAGTSASAYGVTGTLTKPSQESSTTKSSSRTALDSTALDALFREAADELQAGE